MLRCMKPRIAELRARKKWTQEELAAEVGLSVSTIQKYEQNKGGLQALEKIEPIAKALGVHPLALLSEDAERLLNAEHQGYDETTLVEAIRLALETAEGHRLKMRPEQIAKMAVVFYQARFDTPEE